MKFYLIGYQIEGHILMQAGDSQAAAAEANAIVNRAAGALEEYGENEYRSPCGGVVQVSKAKS